MTLKPDQQQERQLGRDNFQTVLGITRRDFLASAAGAASAGALYFGYKRLDGNPVRAGIIGCGDEGQVLVTESNPDFLQFIAYSDIRPYNQKRAMDGENNNVRVGFKRKYGVEAAKKIAERSLDYHDDYHRMLDDPDIEMIVIALPLHLHAKVTIEAMEKGKHVLCEKLMAQSAADCKRMIATSEKTQRLLAVGHQRHYSILYDNAVSVLKSGMLGDIRYIRALWHRNNTFPVLDKEGKPVFEDGRPLLRDGWRKDIPEEDKALSEELLRKSGYKNLEELVRWRLFNSTSAGLMAELGSHQLDASSIFIARGVHGLEHSVHPLAVSGIGVKSFYTDEREADDHIFCTFEFPGPQHGKTKDREDVVIVTYSSINTNAIEHYGETVYGTRSTMLVELERDVLLFKERDPNERGAKPPTATTVSVAKAGDKPVLESSATAPGGSPQAALAVATGQLSKGYREEMEHFAYQVRRYSPGDYETLTNELRCNGKVAMADAIIALVANMAMKERRRIRFREEWFDPKSDEVPEEAKQLARG